MKVLKNLPFHLLVTTFVVITLFALSACATTPTEQPLDNTSDIPIPISSISEELLGSATNSEDTQNPNSITRDYDTHSTTQSANIATPTSSPSLSPTPAATTTPQDDISASVLSTFSTELVVHFLDVGQADSILVQLPNEQVMLIDGGNKGDADSIINYLHLHNITLIDYLVATHPHADHIGGLPAIIEAFDISSVYAPRVSNNTQAFEGFLRVIESKDLQIDTAIADVSILNLPDLKIDIVAPVREDYKELNDHSAVIKITFDNVSFLFVGDATTASERDITADISSDVLKVGHHGSDTSTSVEFLRKVAPTYAVISVGNNSYGHPSDTTMSRLDDAGINVFRTDLQGTLIFTTNGTEITVNTALAELYLKESNPSPTPQSAPTPALSPSPKPSPTSQPEPSPTPDAIMVWLTATGSKYHRINNCGRTNPDKATQVTLESAKLKYDPCSNCNPPK